VKTLQDRAALALQQIESELAVCDAATPGRWHVTEHNPLAVDARDEYCIAVADPMISRSGTSEANAAFIGTARTGYPAALLGLKLAIEWLLKLEYNTSTSCVYDLINGETSRTLDAILTEWERSRE
jgi:hypothetical protein